MLFHDDWLFHKVSQSRSLGGSHPVQFQSKISKVNYHCLNTGEFVLHSFFAKNGGIQETVD